MANPMHCDAQRNALGLSLQSIAFFHAPSRSEISYLHRCTGKDENTRFSARKGTWEFSSER